MIMVMMAITISIVLMIRMIIVTMRMLTAKMIMKKKNMPGGGWYDNHSSTSSPDILHRPQDPAGEAFI